jgi:hypothetical protein
MPPSVPRATQPARADSTNNEKFTVDVDFILAPNGENPVLLTEHSTHTNLDTGYSLTEVDQVNQVGQPLSSTVMQVGISGTSATPAAASSW